MNKDIFFFTKKQQTGKAQQNVKSSLLSHISPWHQYIHPFLPLFSLCFVSKLSFLEGFSAAIPASAITTLWMTEVLSTSIWSIFWETCSQDVSTVGNSLKLFPIDLYLCSILDIGVVFYFLLKLLFLVLPFFSLRWKAVTVHLGHGVGGFWS